MDAFRRHLLRSHCRRRNLFRLRSGNRNGKLFQSMCAVTTSWEPARASTARIPRCPCASRGVAGCSKVPMDAIAATAGHAAQTFARQLMRHSNAHGTISHHWVQLILHPKPIQHQGMPHLELIPHRNKLLSCPHASQKSASSCQLAATNVLSARAVASCVMEVCRTLLHGPHLRWRQGSQSSARKFHRTCLL